MSNLTLDELLKAATPLPWNGNTLHAEWYRSENRELVLRLVNIAPRILETLQRADAEVSHDTGCFVRRRGECDCIRWEISLTLAMLNGEIPS